MADDLDIAFSLRDLDGRITVSVSPNTDPAALGYGLLWPGQPAGAASGFPVCRARLSYPADGYAAVFGWTQMVRSTDMDPERFEMDPVALYRDVPTPFAWFGVRPEHFDAPSRYSRHDMRWEAHAFLCVSPDAVITPRVRAIAGFAWGFGIAAATITIHRPRPLTAADWDSHLPLLRDHYPRWAFDEGFTR
ncbi:MAG: hypothetical protein JOY82_23055 [Streptosporangiaceae bacterium]|nr:hypothetical protein [Streptosporangiaceae bacterium]MBV9857361.1 hypothetical protein [Streptosporangiaceae bacterium]